MAGCFRCGRIFVLPPFPRDRRAGQARHAECHPFAAAGLVLIQLVIIIWKKKTAWKQLSPAFTVLVAAFFVLLLVFRNTRGWPVYMVTAFTLLYIFYLSWEKKERFLGILCNGIILNFSVP